MTKKSMLLLGVDVVATVAAVTCGAWILMSPGKQIVEVVVAVGALGMAAVAWTYRFLTLRRRKNRPW